MMYDERVPGGLTGGHLVVSRLVRKTKSSSRFFFGSFLFPFSVGERARHSFTCCSHTPLPQHLQYIPPLLFFPLSLPFFFFFCSPPSTFARPSSVGRPLFVFLSLVDYFPLSTPPPKTTNQPASLRPVYSRSPGIESIAV